MLKKEVEVNFTQPILVTNEFEPNLILLQPKGEMTYIGCLDVSKDPPICDVFEKSKISFNAYQGGKGFIFLQSLTPQNYQLAWFGLEESKLEFSSDLDLELAPGRRHGKEKFALFLDRASQQHLVIKENKPFYLRGNPIFFTTFSPDLYLGIIPLDESSVLTLNSLDDNEEITYLPFGKKIRSAHLVAEFPDYALVVCSLECISLLFKIEPDFITLVKVLDFVVLDSGCNSLLIAKEDYENDMIKVSEGRIKNENFKEYWSTLIDLESEQCRLVKNGFVSYLPSRKTLVYHQDENSTLSYLVKSLILFVEATEKDKFFLPDVPPD